MIQIRDQYSIFNTNQTRGRTPKWGYYLVVGVIIIITLASSSDINTNELLGNAIAMVAVVILLLFYITTRNKIIIPKPIAYTFTIIFSLFIVNSIRLYLGLLSYPEGYFFNTGGYMFNYYADVVGFIVGPIVFLFVIPALISKDEVFKVFAYASVIIVLLGILSYIFGDYYLGWVEVNTYTHLEPFRDYGIYIPAMASVFDDANSLSKVALAGTLSSWYLYSITQRSIYVWTFAINLGGLFLGNSTMSIFGFIVAVGAYWVYIFLGREQVRTVSFISIIGTCTLFLLLTLDIGRQTILSLIPYFTEGKFSGRLGAWEATLVAFTNNPILGSGVYRPGVFIRGYTESEIGPAPQNSYLRVFMMTGIIGGMAYLYALIYSLNSYISQMYSKEQAILFGFFVAFLVVQISDANDPFGLNNNAMIFGIIMGYIISDFTTQTSDF